MGCISDRQREGKCILPSGFFTVSSKHSLEVLLVGVKGEVFQVLRPTATVVHTWHLKRIKPAGSGKIIVGSRCASKRKVGVPGAGWGRDFPCQHVHESVTACSWRDTSTLVTLENVGNYLQLLKEKSKTVKGIRSQLQLQLQQIAG